MYKYPVAKPTRNKESEGLVMKTMKEGWLSSQAPIIKEFEKEWAEYNGMSYGVACSSGTNALVIALKALNLSEGAEVIVPEFTMIATAWAVDMAGYKPIFVDCGDDLNIDVNKIEEKITKNTKAIIPVHIYGRRCDMDKIMEIAYEYNLYVIEDSAEAHGIKPVGDVACYSLFANKIINSGEGGVCVTNNEKLAKQMIHLRGMAFDTNHTFLHKKQAYNFRMNALTGAYALGEVRALNKYLIKREMISSWYDKLLGKYRIKSKKGDVLWMYDIIVPQEVNRDLLAIYLKNNGIETRVFFKPMSDQSMYKNEGELKARDFSNRGLYLPTYTDLSKKDIDYISRKVVEGIKICYNKKYAIQRHE